MKMVVEEIRLKQLQLNMIIEKLSLSKFRNRIFNLKNNNLFLLLFTKADKSHDFVTVHKSLIIMREKIFAF